MDEQFPEDSIMERLSADEITRRIKMYYDCPFKDLPPYLKGPHSTLDAYLHEYYSSFSSLGCVQVLYDKSEAPSDHYVGTGIDLFIDHPPPYELASSDIDRLLMYVSWLTTARAFHAEEVFTDDTHIHIEPKFEETYCFRLFCIDQNGEGMPSKQSVEFVSAILETMEDSLRIAQVEMQVKDMETKRCCPGEGLYCRPCNGEPRCGREYHEAFTDWVRAGVELMAFFASYTRALAGHQPQPGATEEIKEPFPGDEAPLLYPTLNI